jgi:NAD(P)-dependent dehydrogenase (short-subunit alcohol dehydrogenase family)
MSGTSRQPSGALPRRLIETSNDALRAAFETTLLEPLSAVQELGPRIERAGAGRLLRTALETDRADRGPAQRVARSALHSLIRILADELRDFDLGLELPTPDREIAQLPRVKRAEPPRSPVALVTGGTSGMGLESCRQLAKLGIQVVMTGRSDDDGRRAAESLSLGGLRVIYRHLDVRSSEDARLLAAELEESFAGLDVLLNNAGLRLEPLETMGDREAGGILALRPDTLRESLDTQTIGPISVTRALVPLMKERGGGRVINISSQLARESELGVGLPCYRISKSALNTATQLLAEELAADGITVNAVHPGWVKTKIGGVHLAPLSVEDGVRTALSLATEEVGGVETGGFFEQGKRSSW